MTYALQPAEPRILGKRPKPRRASSMRPPAATCGSAGCRTGANALAFDPGQPAADGSSASSAPAGAASKLLVATPGVAARFADNRFTGRLRRFDEVYFADAVTDYFKQTQALRALDLEQLKSPARRAAAPQPLATADRSGEPLQSASKDQELLIDVLFADDLRVLLSKDKFPSEADARREIERIGLPHGPRIETKDGFGYVLRLPPQGFAAAAGSGADRRAGHLAVAPHQTYRVPLGALSVTPAGLVLPGPDALAQPVRYQLTANAAPTPALR